MPGPFSSDHSVSDALALGRSLAIEVRRLDIRPIYQAYLDAFRGLFGAARRLRPHAAEHPGAHPRRAADGGLERRGAAGARDREQERALGGLLHALRRHRGRSGGAGRRLQARRLRARASRERARRADPAREHREAAVGRAGAGTARQRRPARLRDPRPDPRADHRGPARPLGGRAARRGCRPGRAHRGRASTATSTSDARRRSCCAPRPRPSDRARRLPIAQRYRP